MKIGLSLSFCIKDIIEGRVPLSDVLRIEAGTCATPERWPELMDEYAKVYWTKDPERAKRIATNLYRYGMIDQPRLRGEKPANISDGWWIDAPM